jgi:hypothetical protein
MMTSLPEGAGGSIMRCRTQLDNVKPPFLHLKIAIAPSVMRGARRGRRGRVAHNARLPDARYDLRKPPVPTIYVLVPIRSLGTLHVRVAGDARAIAYRLREEVRAATPPFRVTSVTPLTARVNRTLVRERLLALLSGFFALVGVVLTAVGLYGTLSFAVVQRTRARSASASRSGRARSARCARYWRTPPGRR